MNDMTTALKAAGVKVPSIKQRIHAFLVAHPNSTADRIADNLKLKPDDARRVLWTMKHDGSILGVKRLIGDKTYFHYTAAGVDYAPLRPKVPAVIDIAPVPAPAPAPAIAAKLCEGLTLGELYALRTYLGQVLR